MQYKFNLEEVMKKENISIYKLSRDTGITEGTLRKYSKNESKAFDSNNMAKLCKALNCQIQDLLILSNK